MKSHCLIVVVLISISLLVVHSAEAFVCKESQEHKFQLCGNWTDHEVEEILSTLIGDEEIHKIIKQNENYYMLHTCEEKTREDTCMRGFVYVIERNAGTLSIRTEMWEWLH